MILVRDILGATRRIEFASGGSVLSMVDVYRSGETRFEPADVWADQETVAEARARLAAVTEPRRREKVASTRQAAMMFGPVSAKAEGGQEKSQ